MVVILVINLTIINLLIEIISRWLNLYFSFVYAGEGAIKKIHISS